MIYLDYNATTSVARPVQDAMLYVREHAWANPSSAHMLGRKAKEALEQARAKVASTIGAIPSEIIFTSGGTEANNLAILGYCLNQTTKKHAITTSIEHPATTEPMLRLLMEHGWDITFIKVSKDCVIDPADVKKAIKPSTSFISIMLANNETGALQPVKEVGNIARQHGICMHTDACQVLGKLPVDVNDLKVDLLTMAGHKFYAPKGIGALYIKKNTVIQRILFGAGQEHGIRPGTEAVELAAGIGAACEFANKNLETEIERQKKLKEMLFNGLKELWPGITRNAMHAETLPNTLSVSFRDKKAYDLLALCPELMASTGAACHDTSTRISHVLAAMGCDDATARGTVRFSIGRFTTGEEIQKALEIISKGLEKT